MKNNLSPLNSEAISTSRVPLAKNISRRSLLQLLAAGSFTLGTSLAINGCGGGTTSTLLQGRAIEALFFNSNPETVAADQGKAVRYQGQYKATDNSFTQFWGVTDSEGYPQQVLQTLRYVGDTTKGVRTQYDDRGLPVLVVHEENGAFLTVFWDDNGAVIKFFQPDGSLVGGSIVKKNGVNFTAEKLAGTQLTGYFSGRLIGLTDAIVSFNLLNNQGRHISDLITARARQIISAPYVARQTSGDDIPSATFSVTNALGKFASAVGPSSSSLAVLFARDLLSTLSNDLQNGRSGIGEVIIQSALTGAMIAAPFLEGGKPLLRGLVALSNLQSVTQRLQQEVSSGQDIAKKGSLRSVEAQPETVSYAVSIDFTPALGTDDSSRLLGIAAAREFGNIGLTGVITADNQLSLTGTNSQGDRISLTGHVLDNKVDGGQWVYSPGTNRAQKSSRAEGDTSGTWNCQLSQPGSCMQQQNSGSQGIFTQSYDLGSYCGTFDFQYDTFVVPDSIEIFYDSKTIFQVGPVGENNTVPITYSGSSTVITVIVTAPLTGTAWNYNVGCPMPTRGCR